MTAIRDDELLHRRVHPEQVAPDGGLSSAAFRDERLSVDRAELRSLEETLSGHPTHGVVGFSASLARSLGQQVEAAPEEVYSGTVLDWNSAHALVIGHKPRSIARRFAKVAEWIRRPTTSQEDGETSPA